VLWQCTSRITFERKPDLASPIANGKFLAATLIASFIGLMILFLEDVASVYALQGLNTAMNPLSTGGVV
jgi:hypothetical protein